MRLSDADRESLYDKLGRHAAEGRLTLDELERRVAAIDSAQTQQEAASVMADLPPLADPSAQRRPRRLRGHGDADAPAADWQPTDERFRDPRSGRVMRVWVDSAGGRHYVAE
jgi:hypothetical protein